MDHEQQLELIDRIFAHQDEGRGTDTAPSSWPVATSTYTDPDHLELERDYLRRAPTIVGLSGLIPEPRSYATVQVGDASVIVTRDDDHHVHAMLNVCRHRGAEITTGCGEASRLACPYHGWTYHLDGLSAARRRSQFFDDREPDELRRLPVREASGLLWVSADPDGSVPDTPLAGFEAELDPIELGAHRLFATTTFVRPFNWKLAVDTFAEAHHVPILHRATLGPLIHGDFALFDAHGPHGRMVTARKTFHELRSLDRSERLLAPHATTLWFLVPNTVLIHQQDHIQLYQSRPGRTPDEAVLSVSLYVPLGSTRSEGHWQRNFDLLVDVTDNEDFHTAAGIQRGYATRAQTEVVFGQNEPALQHFHRSLHDLVTG